MMRFLSWPSTLPAHCIHPLRSLPVARELVPLVNTVSIQFSVWYAVTVSQFSLQA